MFKAKTWDNIATQEEINKILLFARNTTDWEDGGSEFWSGRSLNAINVYNKNKTIGKILYDIRERVKDKISIDMADGLEVYPDLFQIVRWYDGMEQTPHADDMVNAGEGYEWFHHRHFGAILYLNDDYSGGHTFYPKYNIEITPKPGTLAVHPGDDNHLHGVTKINGNTRYTLASFWTLDKEYWDGWTLS
jgi:hypothetical protein